MPKISLTVEELYTITNALRVAADQYDADAKTAEHPYEDKSVPAAPGWQRVAEQFKKQATEARVLGLKLDEIAEAE